MMVSLNDMPTLSLLYKLKKIEADDNSTPTYEASAKLNGKISVIKRDITTLAIHAIVNAANNSLLGGGGVDGAIHRAAGPELYDECETLDGCDTGDAKITDAYELPCKKVIHAVGPIYWKEGRTEAARLLAGCYRTSLQLAVDNGCRSIAFSALSTGVYGYPSGEASRVALETVRKFLDEEDKAAKLDRVIFCNFLQKDEDAYFENIPTFFPPSETDAAPSEAKETSNEPSEMLSQLPDAPTDEPKDVEDVQQPSTKKQKTDEPQFNITVLISGNGSNLQALIDACASDKLPNTRVTHVVSNRKAAYGLERAAKASIPTTYHNLVPYKKSHSQTPDGTHAARVQYDADLANIILNLTPRPDLIVCAGWMHIVTPSFLTPITAARIKIINLHPALPGQFAGAGAIERAWKAGSEEGLDKTGVMVHEVIKEVDEGKWIVMEEVALKKDESLEELEERIHGVEHELIVRGTRMALEGLGKGE